MPLHYSAPRRPGRPARDPIDTLKTKVWYWGVAHCLGTQSAYALEKHFSREKISVENGVTHRPCKFDKYKRGEHTPSKALIEQVDKEFPGTRYVFDHVFWEVARCPCLDINGLYERLSHLRPAIARMLFYPTQGRGNTPNRKDRTYASVFEALRKEGDWDALTACIGLIQEARFFGDEGMYIVFTRPAFAVFRRFVSSFPFYMVANELYAYLMMYLLDNPIGQKIQGSMSGVDVRDLASLSTSRILLIEDLDLLKKHFYADKSCLYVAERYLTAPVIMKITNYIEARRWSEVYKMSEIKNLARALQRWEAKRPEADRH
jgi:hypothetical protein